MSVVKTFILSFALLLCAGALRPGTPAAPAAPQCRGTDRVIEKQVRFARGRTTSVVKDTIRLCTGHDYRLRAVAGQTMSVNLVVGRRTALTVRTPSGEALVDGGREWAGELPEDGEYTIQIGTDATARYTLEVTIR